MPYPKQGLKIVDASYHRNGMAGVGFYAVLFEHPDNGRMVASLFDEPRYCAVYSIPKLATDNIRFTENSWRGDAFEEELRPLLRDWLTEHGTNRVGPFSVPLNLPKKNNP